MIQGNGDFTSGLGTLLKLSESCIIDREAVTFRLLSSGNDTDAPDSAAIDYTGIPTEKLLSPETNFTIFGHAKSRMSTDQKSTPCLLFTYVI
jgi:hypothetical protein